MASYEAQIQSIGRTGFGRIPTALEKQGDFSQSVDPRAVQGQLRPVRLADPDAGGRCAARVITGCFPNNQIPLSRMDPIGQRLMEFYPNPTVDDIRFNFISAANDDDNWHSFVGKLDHRFSDNDNVSVSYQKRFNNQENPFAGSALALWGDETTDRRSLLSAELDPHLFADFHHGNAGRFQPPNELRRQHRHRSRCARAGPAGRRG